MDGSDKILTLFNSDLNMNMGGQEEGGEWSCCGGGGDYEANQVPVKTGTGFTYCVCTYVCLQSRRKLVPIFQSAGTLIPFGIPAEYGRNVPPSSLSPQSRIYFS